MSNKLLVIIAGSTGVGKTEVAIKLAQHYQTVVLSADSRQIYQEMNIGVGRPSEEQLRKVKHHFIGHISIHKPYTAATFAKEALSLLDELFKKHDLVILAGGTGLYIKALIEGFDDIPEVPKAIFEKWQAQWEEQGTEELLSSLKEMDPDYYYMVDKANHTRLIRALSVTESSGSPFSTFLKGEKHNLPFKTIHIALDLPRDKLYSRIDQRVIQMINNGWVEEAKSLHPFKAIQALQTVGYKELFSYFEGDLSIDEAIAAIQQATRRYAKRQLTWWRNQGQWINIDPDNLAEIISLIEKAKNTDSTTQ